jgi:hypothetical protein
MKIKMCIYGYGAEYGSGYISEKIWKYIQDVFDGNASLYNEKLDNGEIPDEFKLADDTSMYFDPLNDTKLFFDNYAPYSNIDLIIYNENDEEITTIELGNKKTTINIVENETKPKIGKPYFVWESIEVGYWDVINNNNNELLEINGDFDVNKLKIHIEKLTYNNNCKELKFISSIEYDGEIYHTTLNTTRGKSIECKFYCD